MASQFLASRKFSNVSRTPYLYQPFKTAFRLPALSLYPYNKNRTLKKSRQQNSSSPIRPSIFHSDTIIGNPPHSAPRHPPAHFLSLSGARRLASYEKRMSNERGKKAFPTLGSGLSPEGFRVANVGLEEHARARTRACTEDVRLSRGAWSLVTICIAFGIVKVTAQGL
jgi:hypothetical protein